VRRLFLAAALALAFHSLLFTLSLEGPKAKRLPPSQPLTLSLVQAPAQPSPPPAVSQPQVPPAPPPHPPAQPIEEKTQPKKPLKPEKPSKRVDSSFRPPQEQGGAPSEARTSRSEEVPGSGRSHETPAPTTAALGDRGQASTPLSVRDATPLYRLNPVPDYPMIARKRGYQGTVVLEVLVDRQGRVADLRLSDSCGYAVLDQAAMTSVRTWLFDPGTRGGERVDMWVKVPVRFKLE
jgi:protein TonB